jgi:hypothetical protein
MFYYGTQYSMEDIGSNFGVNMLIVGCLEFLAYFTSSNDIGLGRLLRAQTQTQAVDDNTQPYRWWVVRIVHCQGHQGLQDTADHHCPIQSVLAQ